MNKTAYLGIPGSTSHIAAQQHYGDDSEYVGAKSFREIFQLVARGTVEQGIIPVENSLAGSVYDTYDLLYEYDLAVVGEHFLKIDLHLMGTASAMPKAIRMKSINKVVSHYKALEECSSFLEEHAHMHSMVYTDTADAAKFVADQEDPLMAAIASRETAEIYGLELLAEHIQNDKNNKTRFLIVSKKANTLKDRNKSSIIFIVPHVPGSLVKALQVFSDNGINLIKIESRPVYGLEYEYIFYVDIGWTKSQAQQIEGIIADFIACTESSKILGYYQSGTGR